MQAYTTRRPSIKAIKVHTPAGNGHVRRMMVWTGIGLALSLTLAYVVGPVVALLVRL